MTFDQFLVLDVSLCFSNPVTFLAASSQIFQNNNWYLYTIIYKVLPHTTGGKIDKSFAVSQALDKTFHNHYCSWSSKLSAGFSLPSLHTKNIKSAGKWNLPHDLCTSYTKMHQCFTPVSIPKEICDGQNPSSIYNSISCNFLVHNAAILFLQVVSLFKDSTQYLLFSSLCLISYF
jgi:hypothetical protein